MKNPQMYLWKFQEMCENKTEICKINYLSRLKVFSILFDLTLLNGIS